MFTPQVPEWQSKYAAAGYPVCRTDLAAAFLRDGLPVNGPQGWGLNFLLEGENLQKASAPGLCNCFWVIDRERGVAGMMLSQVLPFGDPIVFPLWVQVEGLIEK